MIPKKARQTVASKLTPTQAEERSMTVFMCEECNSVFLSQDNLAVHILAEHMKQGWSTVSLDDDGTAAEVHIRGTISSWLFPFQRSPRGGGGDLKMISICGLGVLNDSKCGIMGWHKVVLSVILNLKCASRGSKKLNCSARLSPPPKKKGRRNSCSVPTHPVPLEME